MSMLEIECKVLFHSLKYRFVFRCSLHKYTTDVSYMRIHVFTSVGIYPHKIAEQTVG